jgi:hypothetical protein
MRRVVGRPDWTVYESGPSANTGVTRTMEER